MTCLLRVEYRRLTTFDWPFDLSAAELDLMLASMNQLVDALTGLERILTTPIPFS